MNDVKLHLDGCGIGAGFGDTVEVGDTVVVLVLGVVVVGAKVVVLGLGVVVVGASVVD